MKNSDFTDLKSFIRDFLNTPDPKQCKKLAEEFRKRHLELHEFLKNNADLISAETDIAKIVNAAVNGEEPPSGNKELTNLLEMIGGALK